LPARHDHGIAVVGCGGIVRDGHLPAYRAAGLNVLGLHDVRDDAARELAGTYSIGRVYSSLDEVLADDDVEVVDVAVHPAAQPEIAQRVLAAGRHVLCQKPLALSLAEAQRIARAADENGRCAAVNQQMRWSGGIATLKAWTDRGLLGQPLELQIRVSTFTPWHLWPWLAESPTLDLPYHSIHYLDASRYLLGEPELVTCRLGRSPRSAVRGETRSTTLLEYAIGAVAQIAVNHDDASHDGHARLRMLGSEGVARGTIGLFEGYPRGVPDTLEFRRIGEDSWTGARIDDLWIPDAFLGPMASLLSAVESGGEPLTSVRDNLRTLRLVEAAYASHEQRRSIVLPPAVDEAREVSLV
jgi:predicted dehydrogenase